MCFDWMQIENQTVCLRRLACRVFVQSVNLQIRPRQTLNQLQIKAQHRKQHFLVPKWLRRIAVVVVDCSLQTFVVTVEQRPVITLNQQILSSARSVQQLQILRFCSGQVRVVAAVEFARFDVLIANFPVSVIKDSAQWPHSPGVLVTFALWVVVHQSL